MDGVRFDRLARGLAGGASRRRVLAMLGGVALAGLGRRAGAAQMVPPAVDLSGMPCGGIAGIPCPGGYVCVDDPADGCDPATGADCGGRCQREEPGGGYNPCAAILCIVGTTCCPNCGGICVPPGTACTDALCGGEPCGAGFCAAGEFCCNPSCGICAPLGGYCTEQYCG